MKMKKNNKKQNLSFPLYDELIAYDEDLLNEHNSWETPTYISQNLTHIFRDYQNAALRFFHYTQISSKFKHRKMNHLLFNMATGSGKTDLMAGIILYLFKEHGYKNFLFVVNTKGVLNKTIDNLTNPGSEKYLYNRDIEIEGERIEIRKVNVFPKVQSKNTIYIKLSTVQSVARDLYTQKENSMGKNEYSKNKLVILGDEAHHYSNSTKSDKELELTWENAILEILNTHSSNLLLEFTATIDISNKKIYQKYKDIVLYRYTLDRFIQDRYSKNVKRIQSSNKDTDNMLNAVLISQYRQNFADKTYHTYIKPVIMFKSQRIDYSIKAEAFFNTLIESLTVDSLMTFLMRQNEMAIRNESEVLTLVYSYFLNHKNLEAEIQKIKREFSSKRIINANDTDRTGILEKGQYNALNSLESPTNIYRVIFAVAKLTEGWDVLNLYDIVRLSDDPKTSGKKSMTMAEAQLIGRGARYNPLTINQIRLNKRRFTDGSRESLILETLHYHTVNEPQYLKNLNASLDDMNLPSEEDKKNPLFEIKVKDSFKKTNLFKNGKIYYNETIEIKDEYYDCLEKYGINTKKEIVIPFLSNLQEVDYKDEIIYEDTSNMHNIPITIDKRYFKKIMNKLSFYHFTNLKRYVPLLKSRDEFLGEKWLNIYNRSIYAEVPIDIHSDSLTSSEKLSILEYYFKEIAKKIQVGYTKKRGTGKFIGYPIKDYITNYRKREPKYITGNLQLHKPQNVNRYEFDDNFFIYDSAIINITEKQLIERISERVQELNKKFDEVYLIRMDENMHRESVKNEELKLHQFGDVDEIYLSGFQPDFILYLKNESFSLQMFIEVKGPNKEEEQWKEDLLLYISNHEDEIVIDEEYEDIKIKGVKFYTYNDGKDTIPQIGHITLGKNFESLSVVTKNDFTLE